jgi:hypothetical protein
MPSGPVRRAQLIAPFGTGAMSVVRDGTSLVTAGLDHWFERETGGHDNVDIDEFRIKEWRLERQLRVDHFRLPPDYRQKRQYESAANTYLTVPFLRFPRWHVCPWCKRLHLMPLTVRGRIKCSDCASKKKNRYLVQVPFVAMCDEGHLQDFPWREWVHYSANPSCDRPLRLSATGGASLASQIVRCDCGKQRPLSGITEASPDGQRTYLSSNLTGGEEYRCRGRTPWLGTDEDASCPRPLRGSLRSASNVYYAVTRSAIYIPRGGASAPPPLVTLLGEDPRISSLIDLLAGAGQPVTPELLRRQYPEPLVPYSAKQIEAALNIVLGAQEQESAEGTPELEEDDLETSFRRPEFEVLRTSTQEDELLVELADSFAYKNEVARYFSRIALVHKLRETRALSGFARVFPENEQSLEQQKAFLWRRIPPRKEEWLPAYTVYGEGIYLELDESLLQAWERRAEVQARVRLLLIRYQRVREARKLHERPLDARFILLHTLAHLLMNRLTFECGYSSAALRERLYVSADERAPMAGILIYTAAGDAEGTMGGLVRMGKPGYLEPAIRRAMESAQWCSADPVCMEMGRSGGQGPDGCNLAACHNCGLVPETACEQFNRFLDRGVIVGDLDDRELGFFCGLVGSKQSSTV